MDNFQLALKAEGSAEQLRAGVELILKQMEEALKGLNVQAVETVGAQFDPRIHEALGSIETTEFPDHQVLEEIRRGTRFARSCCGRRWCGLRRIRPRYRTRVQLCCHGNVAGRRQMHVFGCKQRLQEDECDGKRDED